MTRVWCPGPTWWRWPTLTSCSLTATHTWPPHTPLQTHTQPVLENLARYYSIVHLTTFLKTCWSIAGHIKKKQKKTCWSIDGHLSWIHRIRYLWKPNKVVNTSCQSNVLGSTQWHSRCIPGRNPGPESQHERVWDTLNYKTVPSTVCLGKWPGIQELKFIKEASRWALTRIKVKCWLVLTMLFLSAFHGFEVVISPNRWNEIHAHKVHAVRHLRWSRTYRAFSYSPFYQLLLGNVCYDYSWYSFQMIIRFCTFY